MNISEFSLTETGPEGITGVTNFSKRLYSSKNPNQVVGNLWFLDSNVDICSGDNNSWGCIESEQIDWFKTEADRLRNANGMTEDLAFYHIPLPEMLEVINSNKAVGNRNEPVNCPKINTGFFEASSHQGSFVKAHFFGHDHGDDFYGEYEHVWMFYGRKSGYGGYSLGDMEKGARVIELEEDSINPTYTFKQYVLNAKLEIEPNPSEPITNHHQDKCVKV